MSNIIELENEAQALREAGKNEEAIEAYKKVLELDENFVRAHLALAILYTRGKDAERSVYHGEKATELEPNEGFNYMALSKTYQEAFEITRDTSFIEKAEVTADKARQVMASNG